MAENLQKKNILVMILLVMVTYGIYIPIWFMKQRNAINNLKSKEKIPNGPIIFVLVIFILSAIMFIPSIIYENTSIGNTIDWIDSAINIIGGLTIIVISFKIKKILNEHYNAQLSGLGTFFLTLFYLQYKINQFLEIK
jgi:H+/Cl- antiporter ClcA